MKNRAVYISGSRMSFLGVQEVLKPLEVEVIHGTATNYQEVIKELDDIHLVVIDLDKSNIGLSLFASILEFITSKVLVITHDLSQDYIKTLFKSSFDSCLTKDCSEEELLEAVEALFEGKQF